MKILRFEEYNEIKVLLEKANLYNEEHQTVVYNLAKNIDTHLHTYPQLGLELAFQTNIDREDAASKRVDIIVREKGTGTIQIAIDVCATSIVEQEYNRLAGLRLINNIDEIFIYDYQQNKWLSNNRHESSYSSVLGVNLSDFIS